MDTVKQFGAWLWFRKFVIGVILASVLFTGLIVGYKDQTAENKKQNEQLTQVVQDLTRVVAEQEALRVANDVTACEASNTSRKIISDTIDSVVQAIIAASPEPKSPESLATLDAVATELAKLEQRDCSQPSVNVPEMPQTFN
jgi:hypothetical protein